MGVSIDLDYSGSKQSCCQIRLLLTSVCVYKLYLLTNYILKRWTFLLHFNMFFLFFHDLSVLNVTIFPQCFYIRARPQPSLSHNNPNSITQFTPPDPTRQTSFVESGTAS